MRDATDWSHFAVGIDGAGARHESPSGELAWAELIHHCQREHQASRRPAHIRQVIFHGEVTRGLRHGSHAQKWHGIILRLFPQGFRDGAQFHLVLNFSLLAEQRDGNLVPRLMLAHFFCQLIRLGDLHPVHLAHDVIDVDFSTGRGIIADLHDHHLGGALEVIHRRDGGV